jgi:hypothetical protein
MMEAAASQLHDCAAWFGYCGDQKAMRVNLRVGYTRTRYPNLIVRWFTELSDESKLRLIDSAAAIGPF